MYGVKIIKYLSTSPCVISHPDHHFRRKFPVVTVKWWQLPRSLKFMSLSPLLHKGVATTDYLARLISGKWHYTRMSARTDQSVTCGTAGEGYLRLQANVIIRKTIILMKLYLSDRVVFDIQDSQCHRKMVIDENVLAHRVLG
jgi:hypothetical protein